MDDAVVINEVFEATVEESLVNPTFVIDYPAALCPLTKRKKAIRDMPSGSSFSSAVWNLPTPIPN